MATKIVAARLATAAGVMTVITKSSNPGNILNIVRYVQAKRNTLPPGTPTQNAISQIISEDSLAALQTLQIVPAPLHTRFIPSDIPIRDRYFWLLHGLSPHGTIYIDAGAHRALANKAGLLPVGIVDVEGHFAQQEAVRLCVVERVRPSSSKTLGLGNATKSWTGVPIEVGRALVNYSASELLRIKGVRSSEITDLLGYCDSEYVALRENISFFDRGPSRPVTPGLEKVIEPFTS